MKREVLSKLKMIFLTWSAAVLLTNVAYAAEQLRPFGARATSYILGTDSGDYVPDNLIDCSLSTAWAENVIGRGEGESVTITLEPDTVLTCISVDIGYLKNIDSFFEYGAPTSLICEVGGQELHLNLENYAYDYDEAAKGADFLLDSGTRTNGTVTFTIESARAGSVYDETCITDIYLFGNYDCVETVDTVTAASEEEGSEEKEETSPSSAFDNYGKEYKEVKKEEDKKEEDKKEEDKKEEDKKEDREPKMTLEEYKRLYDELTRKEEYEKELAIEEYKRKYKEITGHDFGETPSSDQTPANYPQTDAATSASR